MAGSHREVEDKVLKERGQDENCKNTWDLMYMRKTKTEQGQAETTIVRRAYGARHGEPSIMLARRGQAQQAGRHGYESNSAEGSKHGGM